MCIIFAKWKKWRTQIFWQSLCLMHNFLTQNINILNVLRKLNMKCTMLWWFCFGTESEIILEKSYLWFSLQHLDTQPQPVFHSESLEKTHIPPERSEKQSIQALKTVRASVCIIIFFGEFWNTHQVHLSCLQVVLLLPQFLTMQQLHTEVLIKKLLDTIRK